MTCNDCIHSGVCAIQLEPHYILDRAQKLMRESNNVEHECLSFKDRSRFVELTIARRIRHERDIEKMRDFHKSEVSTPHGRPVDAERFRIPMKATIKSESFKGRQLSVGYFCPKCHKPVLIRHLYCYECGQALDWGDCS